MASNLYLRIDDQRVAMQELVDTWREVHDVQEAATVKAQAQALMRQLTSFLKDRTIPEALRKEVEDVRVALRRKWEDLEAEASAGVEEPSEEGPGVPYTDLPWMSAETAEAAGPVTFAESASARIVDVDLGEAAPGDDEPLVYVDFVVIEPGWGNTRDNNYYSPEMVREYAHKFQGAKMYPTEHDSRAKTVEREWAEIIKCPVDFTETGAPIGRAAVYNKDMAYSVRQRAKAGRLESLQCSIHAVGDVERGYKAGGRSGNKVKSIKHVESVDLVSRAGAGGRAVAMFQEDSGGIIMSDAERVTENDEPVVEIQEIHEAEAAATPTEAAETSVTEDQPTEVLTASDIVTALTEASLPNAAMVALSKRTYDTREELDAAIAETQTIIDAVVAEASVASGKGPAKAQAPEANKWRRFSEGSAAFGLGTATPPDQKGATGTLNVAEDHGKNVDAIFEKWGTA